MTSSCTLDANRLSEFDVHHIQPSNRFTLHAANVFDACTVQGSLSLCLLPPTERLATMCNASLSNYFASVLNGEIKTLNDLPVVWDAPFALATNDPWILRLADANQFSSSSFYLGLQPLPFFQDIAVSNSYSAFWGVIHGRLFQSNVSTGFLQSDHSQVQGTDDMFQSVALNEDGTIGIVMFSNAVFLWSNNVFTLMPSVDSTEVFFIGIKLFSLASTTDPLHLILVAQHNTTGVVTLWHFSLHPTSVVLIRQTDISFPGSENSVVQWFAVTMDGLFTVIGIDPGPTINSTSYPVFLASNSNDAVLPQLQWNVPRVLGSTTVLVGASRAICRGSMTPGPPGVLDLLVWHKAFHLLQRVTLSVSSSVTQASIVETNICFLTETLSRSHYAFGSSITNLIRAGNTVNPLTWSTVASEPSFSGKDPSSKLTNMVLFPGFAVALAFFDDHTFFVCNNNSINDTFGFTWLHDYDMFSNENAQVSDFGTLTLLPQPQQTWFFGYGTTPLVQPGDTVVSPHQYFRLHIHPQPTVAVDRYATIGASLEQANMRALLTLPTNSACLLLNDSNVRILTNANTVTVWERRTTDGFWSTDDATSAATATHIDPTALNVPYVSKNGLYICFVDSGTNTIKVCFNVFNSAAFAQYCSEDPERRSRAIAHQRDFCASALAITSSSFFADARCTCIADPQTLLQSAFPSRTFSDITTARLTQTLPCLLNSCQDVVLAQENSNVAQFLTEKCKGAPLALCSSIINLPSASELKMADAVVIQNCGANAVPCDQDNKCPFGASCLQGTCVPNCVTNQDCGNNQTCSPQGVCVTMSNVTPVIPVSNKPSKMSITLCIIFGSILALCLLFLLLVLVIKSKTQKEKFLAVA